jgi:hypothetical protein
VVLAVYAVMPLPSPVPSGGHPVARAAGLVCGVVVLAWLVTLQARRALRPDRLLAEQVALLFTLVMVVAVFFACLYFSLAGQFTGLRTRLDALYFSVATLCTVGYGDVAPDGQAARAVAVVQMIFDLVILTSAISVVVGGLRRGPGRS